MRLPEAAAQVLGGAARRAPGSYATRFAAGFEGVAMVLSGMSNLEQMRDNLSYMKEFRPLDAAEQAAIGRVCEVFRSMHLILCTACRYCTDGCPRHIAIPDLFSLVNAKQIHHDWNANYYYGEIYTKHNGKASDCIGCGRCEAACPQHLPIRRLLQDVVKEFETT